jgi:glycosyltransferase involved in cell wall biosynthesis
MKQPVLQMSLKPLVSIALCTYNGTKYLRLLLDSLISQTYKNIEIIIVDDCSADNTYNILKEYESEYNNIHIYQNEYNLGFVKNFEKAISYCKGEYIALCDQDDIWLPQKIELQVNSIGNNLLIYHDSELVDNTGITLHKKMSDMFNFYKGDQPEVFLLFNCVSGHSMMIKRELIVYALPIKDALYHDWWLAYVATNHGSITYIPECLVKYRQHESSDTDLLGIKSKKKDKYRQMTLAQLINRDIRWLKQCVEYPGNKNAAFIKEFYRLYIGRINSYMAFGLVSFMLKNKKLLFYIDKGSKKSATNYILKMAWGLKAKNMWYSYIRINREKIIKLDLLM